VRPRNVPETKTKIAVFYKNHPDYGWDFWGWAKSDQEEAKEIMLLKQLKKPYFTQEVEVPEG